MNAKTLKIAVQRVVLTALLAVSLFFTACQSAGEKNPYDLDLISTTKEYLASIEADSTNLLTDLDGYIPGLILDIRYADTNNFTGTKIYTAPKAYLRKAAADSLLKIQSELAKEGLGIKVLMPTGPILPHYISMKSIRTQHLWQPHGRAQYITEAAQLISPL